MPLGRDSIKRVKNNGYTRISTSAPDMENSSIAEPVEMPVIVVDIPVLESEPVKTPKKATPKKKSEPKQSEPKQQEPKKVEPAPKKKTSAKKKAEPETATKTKRKTAKKTTVTNSEIPTPTEVAETVARREGEGYINLGGSLPIYLL